MIRMALMIFFSDRQSEKFSLCNVIQQKNVCSKEIVFKMSINLCVCKRKEICKSLHDVSQVPV